LTKLTLEKVEKKNKNFGHSSTLKQAMLPFSIWFAIERGPQDLGRKRQDTYNQ